MASVSVEDGPCAGKVVHHANPPHFYRFVMPRDFGDVQVADDPPVRVEPIRYWLYALHPSVGCYTYRYVGTDEGPPQKTIAQSLVELKKTFDDLAEAYQRILLNTVFPLVLPGKNIGPQFGLPENAGGLGLTSGVAGEMDGEAALRVGWRWWLVDGDGMLTGTIYRQAWPVGSPLEAKHKGSIASSKHKVPGMLVPLQECSCGIYARETPSGVQAVQGDHHRFVLGVAVGWGRVVQHRSGWRAQYAQPLCLVRPLEEAGELDRGAVAARYGIPYVKLTQAYHIAEEFTV